MRFVYHNRASLRPERRNRRQFSLWNRRLRQPPLEAAAGADQAHDHKQDDGAEGGIDDFRHQPAAKADAELWEQQTRDQGADDADRESPRMPKPVPCTILPASQPATRPTNRMTRTPSLEMYM